MLSVEDALGVLDMPVKALTQSRGPSPAPVSHTQRLTLNKKAEVLLKAKDRGVSKEAAAIFQSIDEADNGHLSSAEIARALADWGYSDEEGLARHMPKHMPAHTSAHISLRTHMSIRMCIHLYALQDIQDFLMQSPLFDSTSDSADGSISFDEFVATATRNYNDYEYCQKGNLLDMHIAKMMKRRLASTDDRSRAEGKPLVARRSALRDKQGGAYTRHKKRVLIEGLATSLQVDDKTVRGIAREFSQMAASGECGDMMDLPTFQQLDQARGAAGAPSAQPCRQDAGQRAHGRAGLPLVRRGRIGAARHVPVRSRDVPSLLWVGRVAVEDGVRHLRQERRGPAHVLGDGGVPVRRGRRRAPSSADRV